MLSALAFYIGKDGNQQAMQTRQDKEVTAHINSFGFDIRDKLVLDNIKSVEWWRRKLLSRLLKKFWMDNNLGKCAYALAAPQIGLRKQMFYVNNDTIGITGQVFTNPKIILEGDQFLFKNEACLSFPGHYKDKWRHSKVKICSDEMVSYKEYEGKAAIVLQHEMDHLSGRHIMQSSTKRNNVNKPSRNDPCFCGSGFKFKRCCQSY